MIKRIGQLCLLLLISVTTLFAQQPDSTMSASDDSLTKIVDQIFNSFQVDLLNKKVRLVWSIHVDSTADYFAIERNSNGKNFETIGVIKSASDLTKFEYMDELPVRGTSIYRIRFTNKDGVNRYSTAQNILLPGTAIFSFYPNPVDNVIILRCDSPVDVQVTDGLGKQRISKSLPNGPSIIDVTTLEKGAYLIRVTDKTSGAQQSEKFLKN
ncbi:MAG TPA: T9SS type A sorting domain-containing protein [Chitinophagaceae bacterium]|nr:T9SS type A sorting domain-containing protein [Chitinophagaceae bacterium]